MHRARRTETIVGLRASRTTATRCAPLSTPGLLPATTQRVPHIPRPDSGRWRVGGVVLRSCAGSRTRALRSGLQGVQHERPVVGRTSTPFSALCDAVRAPLTPADLRARRSPRQGTSQASPAGGAPTLRGDLATLRRAWDAFAPRWPGTVRGDAAGEHRRRARATAQARRWDWHVTVVDARWNAAMCGAPWGLSEIGPRRGYKPRRGHQTGRASAMTNQDRISMGATDQAGRIRGLRAREGLRRRWRAGSSPLRIARSSRYQRVIVGGRAAKGATAVFAALARKSRINWNCAPGLRARAGGSDRRAAQVRQEFEARRLIGAHHPLHPARRRADDTGICLTNYEPVRDGKLDPRVPRRESRGERSARLRWHQTFASSGDVRGDDRRDMSIGSSARPCGIGSSRPRPSNEFIGFSRTRHSSA